MEDHKKKSSLSETANRWTTRVGRFTITGLLVIVILYTAVLIIPRTRGFRYFLEERLSGGLGQPVHIDSSYMTPTLRLFLRAIRVEVESEFGEAGLLVEEAEVRWSLLDFLVPTRSAVRGLAARNGSLVLVPGPKGGWEPGLLSDAGDHMLDWLGVDLEDHFDFDDPPEPAESPPPKDKSGEPRHGLGGYSNVGLTLSNGSLSWRGYEGELLASASGIHLQVTPLHVPGRRWRHMLLEVGQLRVDDGVDLRDVRLEVLATEQRQVLLGFDADWRKGKPAADKSPVPEPAPPPGASRVARPDRAASPSVSPKRPIEDRGAVRARIKKALEDAVVEEAPAGAP